MCTATSAREIYTFRVCRALRWNPFSVQWLIASLVVSVVLTVLLNLVLRWFPGAGDRLAREVVDLASSNRPGRTNNSRAHVIAPWKAMLLASLILTLVINAWLWLT
jgi:hypothetical protein